jgi:Ser/Thr protein kinase RdoA (MazF antagonist)
VSPKPEFESFWVLLSTNEKNFFFEKKKQKTFVVRFVRRGWPAAASGLTDIG